MGNQDRLLIFLFLMIFIIKNCLIMEKMYNNEHEAMFSDKNVKENIELIENGYANQVRNVNFYSFNYKNDDSKEKVYGVIAQEVQKAGLENIVHQKDGDTLSVDYTSLFILKFVSHDDFLYYVLSKCLKLEEEVKKLKEENEKLNEKLENKKD